MDEFSIDTRKGNIISSSFKLKKDARLLFVRASPKTINDATIEKSDSNIILGITKGVSKNTVTKAILFSITSTSSVIPDDNIVEKNAIGRMANLFFVKTIDIFYKDKFIIAPVYSADILEGEENASLILLEVWYE